MIKLTDLILSDELNYHLDNRLSLHENIFRYSSSKFLDLFREAREAFNKGLIPLSEQDISLISTTDIGLYGDFKGERVALDLPMLLEAEYQGKAVDLNKPKRGGSKKFYVYVKDPKSGNVKKVSFGAKSGGQKLSVKLDDPKARKAFSDRHKCSQKKDKTKAGYWACRITRYWKQLGGSKNYSGYW